MKLIYLEWEDSIAALEEGWLQPQQALDWAKNTDCIVKQIGWLIQEDKKYITIAGAMYDATNFTNQHFCNLQKIPMTWIRKRIDLTKHIK